jgi:hypothetical protein
LLIRFVIDLDVKPVHFEIAQVLVVVLLPRCSQPSLGVDAAFFLLLFSRFGVAGATVERKMFERIGILVLSRSSFLVLLFLVLLHRLGYFDVIAGRAPRRQDRGVALLPVCLRLLGWWHLLPVKVYGLLHLYIQRGVLDILIRHQILHVDAFLIQVIRCRQKPILVVGPPIIVMSVPHAWALLLPVPLPLIRSL